VFKKEKMTKIILWHVHSFAFGRRHRHNSWRLACWKSNIERFDVAETFAQMWLHSAHEKLCKLMAKMSNFLEINQQIFAPVQRQGSLTEPIYQAVRHC
jgi:hypothetical protein